MFYNLRELRTKKGLTQEELSTRSNVSRTTIVKIESGGEVEVKINTLESLAKALECSVGDFLRP